MELSEKIAFADALITSSKRHSNYNRVIRLSKEYKALITGENFSFLLKRFIKREDDAAFKQRLEITQPITAAVASSIIKPFRKVTRNDKVKKKIEFKDRKKSEVVKDIVSTFGNSNIEENNGLDGFLNDEFFNLTFSDPNAFIVCEWKNDGENKVPKPYPFVVNSKEAIDFKYNGVELEYLLVHQIISFFKIEQGRIVSKKGNKFIYYGVGHTFTYTEFDKEYLNNYSFLEAELIKKEINGKNYIFESFDTKLNFVPAVRIGYEPDIETNSETFVNPFHTAISFFRKSIKTVSEFDLTMTLHAFPQKYQYVEKCQGETKVKKCNAGQLADGSQCPKCKGSGVVTHASAQDAIYLPMPKSGDSDLIDLTKLSHYVTPPIDLVKFQKEYIDSLKTDAHLAVFNSQIFISSELQTAQTATEVNNNMDGVYTTLTAFAEKYSKVYKTFVKIFAELCGIDEIKSENIIHLFPADLKLKTVSQLLSELKTANESGAPAFLRTSINDDIAENIFAGDDDEKNKYYIKKLFFPFNGSSESEIQIKLASQYVDDEQKVLYSNFDAIFNEIDREKPDFFLLDNFSKQWEIVREKITEFTEKTKTKTPEVSFEEYINPNE